MDSKDYSNGAYYWDGTDYKTTSRYKRGTIFTKEEHNIWKLAKNAKPGKNEYGKWDAVYETTQAIGLTTFSKLTEKFINTRYRKGVKVKWDGTKK